MPADTAKYMLSIADASPENFEVTDFYVNMPFLPEDGRNNTDQNGSDYGGSKNIRLAQPSGGRSLELDDGEMLARLRSEKCEMFFKNAAFKGRWIGTREGFRLGSGRKKMWARS